MVHGSDETTRLYTRLKLLAASAAILGVAEPVFCTRAQVAGDEGCRWR